MGLDVLQPSEHGTYVDDFDSKSHNLELNSLRLIGRTIATDFVCEHSNCIHSLRQGAYVMSVGLRLYTKLQTDFVQNFMES